LTFGNCSSNSPRDDSENIDEHTREWNYHNGNLIEDELDEPKTVTDGALIDNFFRHLAIFSLDFHIDSLK
jgi:hypothetical protein